MNILDLLDRPIAYHRIFARLTGSVHAALMLSQAVYWQNRATSEDGWWWKTTDEWEEETGLSRREQDTARRILRSHSFWREERRGIPPKVHYRLDGDKLRISLENDNLHKNAKLICTNPPNRNGGKRQIDLADSAKSLKEHRLHTEITTETTTPPTGGGSGSDSDLEKLTYPACLAGEAKRNGAAKRLAGLNPADAQNLLDAVAWQAQNGGFKTRDGHKSTPLRFLDYLRREFEAGRFDDSGALEIQEKRRPPQSPQPAKARGGVPEEFRKFGGKTKQEVNQ